MARHLEILLFNLGNLYRNVPDSARKVCAERGIPLQEIDLSYESDLARRYRVKGFPWCLLLCDGELIAISKVVDHSPRTFSTWIDEALSKPV